MARKSAFLKLKDVVKVPKEWQWQIDNLKKLTPVAGTEERYERYVTSVMVRLKQLAKFEQACELHEQHLSVETRKLMKKEGDKLSNYIHAELGALDAWRHQCKHIDDVALAGQDEFRSIVIASLSDKLDELMFSVNGGILGSKVAQSIRDLVSEDDTLEAPLCREHAL